MSFSFLLRGVVMALVVAACTATADPTPAAKPRIVATTSILGDLVSQLAGDAATVATIMPPGADPHAFAPSPAQAQAMRDADLLVANGANLEEGMIDVIESAEADGANVFEAMTVVDPLPPSAEDEHAEDEHAEDEHAEDEHEHAGGADPHFWTDPNRTAAVVTALAQRIAEADDTLDEEEWLARGQELAGRLAELDAELADILAVVPDERRVLVTNHEAFGYFADRYDFEVIGTVMGGGSTLAEPSAADLEELARTIEETGVPAVFAENIDSADLAEAVAAEAGTDVAVAVLYSGAVTEEGEARTYEEMMRANAQTIAEALG